ncbi:MAG: aspartate 1-decarboxylase [Opitutales bacterium]
MQRTLLKAKIHRATVTDADLNYEGSISIDPVLCEQADLQEFEQVDIYNCNNGARFTTYVIYGRSGEICLNGAAARHVHRGDLVIIANYAVYTEEEALNHKPRLIFVDEHNRPKIHVGK